MKIVQINAVYKYSSTGRNVYETHQWLTSQGHQSFVFWAIKNTADKMEENVVCIGNKLEHKIHALITRIVGDYGCGSFLSTLFLCRKLNDISPDIVHLHNLHSNYINTWLLFKFLSYKKIPVALTLHDCWFFTGGCMHFCEYQCQQWKGNCTDCPMRKGIQKRLKYSEKSLQRKKNSISNVEKLAVLGVSQWIMKEASYSYLEKSFDLRYIYNWLDFNVFFPHNAEDIRSNLGVGEQKVLLFVSNSWLPDSKGIVDIPQIAKCFSSHMILVIGRNSEILKGIKNVVCIPFTNDAEELAKYYSIADVFINPSRMETFGKVTAEALACGTPVVVYENTGTKELCENGCGEIAINGDIEDLKKKITIVLEKGKTFYTEKCIESARSRFSIENAMKKHLDVYSKLISA